MILLHLQDIICNYTEFSPNRTADVVVWENGILFTRAIRFFYNAMQLQVYGNANGELDTDADCFSHLSKPGHNLIHSKWNPKKRIATSQNYIFKLSTTCE